MILSAALTIFTVVVLLAHNNLFIFEVHGQLDSSEFPNGNQVVPVVAISPGEFSKAKLTPDEILNILLQRYNENLTQRRRESRKLSEEVTEKQIIEMCGTSSSLVCGRVVLQVLDTGEEEQSIEVKCNIRKDFLNCIDAERINCKILAEGGVYPQLPPEKKVLTIQERIWRSLWTSGGCLLGN